MSGLAAAVSQAQALVDRAFTALSGRVTHGGRLDPSLLDAQQVPSHELAFCAAELSAARAMSDYGARLRATDALAGELADMFAYEVLNSVVARLVARPGDFGLQISEVLAAHPAAHPALARCGEAARIASIGRALIERHGRLPPSGLDHEKELMRDAFIKFAGEVVASQAQRIHRDDLDVPEPIIAGAAALGLFGLSIPQRYGGLQPDDHADTLAMLVVTEALSAASLGAAGSLITRPEIMARALLAGGTDEQKARWLPRLASGEKRVAISITEPDFGSDVAQLRLRATRVAGGWRLGGAKTWCTWAGGADVLLVIARTAADIALGHRGLSMLMVEKPRYPGREFEHRPASGGRLSARAIATIGYRGMHSFDLLFEDYFVPDSHLVGGTQGEGRGFRLTMAGLTGGRVQTAARACGVMQAAFDSGLRYAMQRRVFGQAIASYSLTQARLARVAAWLTASRQLNYAVARRIDAGGGEMEASLVKLFACRAAEWVTRDMMQIFGGMGYAEETDASRYFVDARVLSIFEGAEETLALKVVARELIQQAGGTAAA